MKTTALTEKQKIAAISILLFCKIVILSFLIWSIQNNAEISKSLIHTFVFKADDYTYFLRPVDNFFNTGHYGYFPNTPFAGRMPGYWILYYAFRFIFSQGLSLQLLIVFQITLSIIANYFLAKAVYLISKNKKAFWFCISLCALNFYSIAMDLFTQSESLAISTFCFFVYFFTKYITVENNKNKNILFCGIFLTWLIFLRPFMGICLPVIVLVLFFNSKTLKNKILYTSLFLIPFIITESIWVYRNYNLFNKIIPLETSPDISYGKLYGKPWLAIREMTVTFGESPAYFEPNTLGEWFKSTKITKPFPFKSEFYNEISFNTDSLQHLKNLYLKWKKETNDTIEKQLADKIILTANKYNAEYKSKFPLTIFVKNPIIRFKNFIFNSGSSYLPLPDFKQQNIIQKTIKLFTSAYYYFVLISSLLFLFFIKTFDKKIIYTLYALIVVTVFTIVLYSDIQENRYLMPVFPALIIISSLTLQYFYTKLISINTNEQSK